MSSNTPSNSDTSALHASLNQTQLYAQHVALGAKIVDFGGWALPVNYGSQIEEHHAVRQNCGMFDVSHMTVSDVTGEDTLALLSKVLANDINKIKDTTGKAIYSCMLNQHGGVIDDLIVYYINDQHCRLVTNAGTNKKDMLWLNQQASEFDVLFEERPKLALIAVQGPNALDMCTQKLAPSIASTIGKLARFQGAFFGDELVDSDQAFVGRTGYTGEDGVEFIVSRDLANSLWQTLLKAGVQPCGLGARDTLRLESGMALYGNDLDEHHTPLESGLNWTVSLNDDRNFIGKEALKNDSEKNLIGLILQDRGVLRGHQKVLHADQVIGEVTSGTFSPTLEQSIGLARINQQLSIGETVQIAVRQRQLTAVVARFPFVKNGHATN